MCPLYVSYACSLSILASYPPLSSLLSLYLASIRYLEEIHLTALANVLCRPIILLAGEYEGGFFLPTRRDPHVRHMRRIFTTQHRYETSQNRDMRIVS